MNTFKINSDTGKKHNIEKVLALSVYSLLKRSGTGIIVKHLDENFILFVNDDFLECMIIDDVLDDREFMLVENVIIDEEKIEFSEITTH